MLADFLTMKRERTATALLSYLYFNIKRVSIRFVSILWQQKISILDKSFSTITVKITISIKLCPRKKIYDHLNNYPYSCKHHARALEMIPGLQLLEMIGAIIREIKVNLNIEGAHRRKISNRSRHAIITSV
jgi:hypothetical protein